MLFLTGTTLLLLLKIKESVLKIFNQFIGLTCFNKDQTYASCLYICPAGWNCNNALLAEFSQCGGE